MTISTPDGYRRLSLIRLIERIVSKSDRAALRELHDRRSVFQYGEAAPLRLVEFVDRLASSGRAQNWSDRSTDVLDCAHDVTVSKFSNLPSQRVQSPTGGGHANSRKSSGPDCRCYFKAFLQFADMRLREVSHDPIHADWIAARHLQSLVFRHFWLSVLDCDRRCARVVRRYTWTTNTGTITAWMPTAMSGQTCRVWLEQHVEDVDPSRPGESDRVQAIIDARMRQVRILSLFTDEEEIDQTGHNRADVAWQLIDGMSVRGLAEVVAAEKAATLDRQRPAIRILGAPRLRRLITRIFEDLSEGAYEDGRLAREFGLTKATFSRFAGSRWNTPGGKGSAVIPDLWRNTAQTLTHDPVFVAAAQEAGVWSRVIQVVGSVD